MAILNYSDFFDKSRTRGFTIVELLIVVGITVILSSGLAFYSRATERQLILFKEQMKIITALQKAKSLAIVGFGDSLACSYGVNFSASGNLIIFKECPQNNNQYGSGELYEEIKLDGKAVVFSDLGLANVVFIPPEPSVIIDNDANKNEAIVEIKTIDNSATRSIKITNAGQITTQ